MSCVGKRESVSDQHWKQAKSKSSYTPKSQGSEQALQSAVDTGTSEARKDRQSTSASSCGLPRTIIDFRRLNIVSALLSRNFWRGRGDGCGRRRKSVEKIKNI